MFTGRSLIYGTTIRNQFEFSCTTVFGGQGRAHGEMTDPSGLFVDSGGNIISGDSKNDRIQVNNTNRTDIILIALLRYFPRKVNIVQNYNSMNVLNVHQASVQIVRVHNFIFHAIWLDVYEPLILAIS